MITLPRSRQTDCRLSCIILAAVLTQSAVAQHKGPAAGIRRDSVPSEYSVPFLSMPDQGAIRKRLQNSGSRMPTLTPENSFYRRPGDPERVVRASLDNMPILMSDTSAVKMPMYGAQPFRRQPDQPALPRKRK